MYKIRPHLVKTLSEDPLRENEVAKRSVAELTMLICADLIKYRRICGELQKTVERLKSTEKQPEKQP